MPVMSLRARLLAAIAAALLLSLAAGAVLALRDAARMVGAEMVSAMDTATLGIRADTARDVHDEAALRRLVATFDGSRHVIVSLADANGHTLNASHPFVPPRPAPAWFARLATPPLATNTIPAPPFLLLVTPFPPSEIGERWSDARDLVLLLGLLSLLTGALCYATAAHAMRPLRALAAGFPRLGHGERRFQLPPVGPPEIAALTAGFNDMSAALAEAEAQNTRLNSQLLRLAEEERVEIARDLHDEVGPLLFAMTNFTAAARGLIAQGAHDAVPAQLHAIDTSVAALQTAVRDMLGRLRDTAPEPIDLADALGKLIRFWQGIRPDLDFSMSVSAGPRMIQHRTGDTLYHVAQEAVSNAVRHGKPSKVQVNLSADDDMLTLSVTDDGSGTPSPGGFGLLGMHERLAAAGGTLKLHQGQGWTVTARVPAAA